LSSSGQPARVGLHGILTLLTESRLPDPGRDVGRKLDGSAVSNSDLIVEADVRRWAKNFFPEHEFVSEELPDSHVTSDLRSVIYLDPIDGTENFINGLPLWASGISIYTNGEHVYSAIAAPQLEIWLDSDGNSDSSLLTSDSRIHAFSSSTRPSNIPAGIGEYRVLGSSLVNFLYVIRGAFSSFSNLEGAYCWDILPGLNLALASGFRVTVDGSSYFGQPLAPDRKYKFSVERGPK